MVKFYFDEDSAEHRLIAALRSRAMDVATSLDAGMNARDDEAQLMFASEQARILVSANASDFAALHREWLEQGRSDSGILIIPRDVIPRERSFAACCASPRPGSI